MVPLKSSVTYMKIPAWRVVMSKHVHVHVYHSWGPSTPHVLLILTLLHIEWIISYVLSTITFWRVDRLTEWEWENMMTIDAMRNYPVYEHEQYSNDRWGLCIGDRFRDRVFVNVSSDWGLNTISFVSQDRGLVSNIHPKAILFGFGTHYGISGRVRCSVREVKRLVKNIAGLARMHRTGTEARIC